MSSSSNLGRQSLFGSTDNTAFPNPWFDIASQYVPRDMKSTFRWAEYLYMRNETYRSALNRIVRYPITKIKITSEDGGEEAREKYTKLFKETLDMVTFLSWTGIDSQVYGNAFLSVYLPFDRFLVCEDCGLERVASKVTYKFVGEEFLATCPCGYDGPMTRVDRASKDETRVNIIRWNPKEIEIHYNQWSGRTEYYWEADSDTRKRIEQSDPLILNEIPWSILLAVKQKKSLKFLPNQIFHLKEPSLAGVSLEWGMPNCLPVFQNHYYLALLRRANEAVFLDYILPFRIIHPQATQGGTSDPTMYVPLGGFVSRMKSMVQRHRRDPLDIQISPIPVGYQTVSGEGKALLLSDEERMAEERLLNGLGFPAELYYGSLSIQAMPAALRLFENTWSYLTHGFDSLLQWVADLVGDYFSWERVSARLEPVTLADDIEKKQVMLQFAATQQVAQSTALSAYGLDYKEELEKRVDDARLAMQVEQDAQDLRTAEEQLMASEGGAAASGAGSSVFDMVSQAEQLAMQWLGMPYEMRRSQMFQVAKMDQALYALAKDKMQKMRDQGGGMTGGGMMGGGMMGGGMMGGGAGVPPAGSPMPPPGSI